MRYILLAIVTFIMIGCTNDNDLSVRPFGTDKIDSINISGNEITVTTIHTIPTPCWYYYKTESTNNGTMATAKVYAKEKGGICTQEISSFKHSEKFYFTTKGQKTLRFWQNDSTFLDTTITLD